MKRLSLLLIMCAFCAQSNAMQQVQQNEQAIDQTAVQQHAEFEKTVILQYQMYHAFLRRNDTFKATLRTLRSYIFKMLEEYPSLMNRHFGDSRETTLMLALYGDWSPEEYEKLLQMPGIDIDAQNALGETALFKAVDLIIDNGNLETTKKVDLLLAYKANVALTRQDRSTALHAAVKKRGYVWNSDDNKPLPQDFIEAGIANVSKLLKAGADIKAQNKHGFTPLTIATGQHYVQMVVHILEYCANANIKNLGGELEKERLYSCAKRHPEVMQAIDAYQKKTYAYEKALAEAMFREQQAKLLVTSAAQLASSQVQRPEVISDDLALSVKRSTEQVLSIALEEGLIKPEALEQESQKHTRELYKGLQEIWDQHKDALAQEKKQNAEK